MVQCYKNAGKSPTNLVAVKECIVWRCTTIYLASISVFQRTEMLQKSLVKNAGQIN